MMDEMQKTLLAQVADLHEVPEGAYNIRANGQMAGRNTTANIDIISKEDGKGIDIRSKPGTKRAHPRCGKQKRVKGSGVQ